MTRAIIVLCLVALSASCAWLYTLPTVGPRPAEPQIRFTGFSDSDTEWPPHPEGWRDVRRYDLGGELSDSLNYERRLILMRELERAARVQEVLGGDLFVVGIEEPPRDKRTGTPSAPIARVYSATKQRAATIELTPTGAPRRITLTPDVNLPLAESELRVAVQIAKSDPRAADANALDGGAMARPPSADGHRRAFVTLAPRLGTSPIYMAIVDLTTRTVESIRHRGAQ